MRRNEWWACWGRKSGRPVIGVCLLPLCVCFAVYMLFSVPSDFACLCFVSKPQSSHLMNCVWLKHAGWAILGCDLGVTLLPVHFSVCFPFIFYLWGGINCLLVYSCLVNLSLIWTSLIKLLNFIRTSTTKLCSFVLQMRLKKKVLMVIKSRDSCKLQRVLFQSVLLVSSGCESSWSLQRSPQVSTDGFKLYSEDRTRPSLILCCKPRMHFGSRSSELLLAARSQRSVGTEHESQAAKAFC